MNKTKVDNKWVKEKLKVLSEYLVELITQTQQDTLEMIEKMVEDKNFGTLSQNSFGMGYDQALKDVCQTIKKKIGGIK